MHYCEHSAYGLQGKNLGGFIFMPSLIPKFFAWAGVENS